MRSKTSNWRAQLRPRLARLHCSAGERPPCSLRAGLFRLRVPLVCVTIQASSFLRLDGRSLGLGLRVRTRKQQQIIVGGASCQWLSNKAVGVSFPIGANQQSFLPSEASSMTLAMVGAYPTSPPASHRGEGRSDPEAQTA